MGFNGLDNVAHIELAKREVLDTTPTFWSSNAPTSWPPCGRVEVKGAPSVTQLRGERHDVFMLLRTQTAQTLPPRAPSPPPSPPEVEDAERGKDIDLVLNQGKDLDGNPIDLKAPADVAKPANLKGARLEGANLKGAHLEGAWLGEARLAVGGDARGSERKPRNMSSWQECSRGI